MVTLRYRTLVAFLAGVTLTIAVGFAFQSWQAEAAPGDDDTTFVSMAPCRLIDTRPAPERIGPHGTFSADDTRPIVAHGVQGDCTVPTEAVGLSLNVTAVGATAPTYLTIWPDGTRPTASSLNPAPNQPPTPNAVTTTLSSSGSFRVYNLAGMVDVIIDVNGYYTPESLLGLADLQAGQPFAVSAHLSGSANLTPTPTDYLTVTVDAPVAGQVTVNSMAHLVHTVDGGSVRCLITTASMIPSSIGADLESFHKWERGGAANESSISATRTFDISTGASVDYVLACNEALDGARMYGRSLTAIFTPAP